MVMKKTFSNIGTNAAAIGASNGVLALEDQTEALKNSNLPHNIFTIGNQSTACTLFLFLDNMVDLTKPDYILFPSQQITVNLDDGVSFTTLFVVNTHASTEVAIAELKYNIGTLKEVS
jgi:hypothetical protein